jgi:hypothetical protein
MRIVVLILSKENLLQGSVVLVNLLFQGFNRLSDRLDAISRQSGKPVASRDMVIRV